MEQTAVHPKRNKKIITDILKYTGFLALTAYLLYISFKNVHWPDLVNGLLNANYWWVTASMAAGWIAILVRAQRWRIIIEPLNYRPSLKNTYDAVMLTYLANFALPRMGEVVRCGALRKTEKIPFDSLLGTVVLERIFDMFCLVIIVVLVILLRIETFGAFMYDNIWQPLITKGSGNFRDILLAAFIAGLCGIALIIIFRKRLMNIHWVRKIVKLLGGLTDGLKAGFRLKKHNQFFGYTFLLWFLYFMQSYTIMKSMPETAGLFPADALFLMVVGSFGWVMPVQGGLGAFHFLVSMALTAMYGIPQTQGVVFATISHETQSVVMILFGFISLIAVTLISKSHGLKTSKSLSL